MKMMSEKNELILGLIFSPKDAPIACEAITAYLSELRQDNGNDATPDFLERVSDALLKASHGNTDKLAKLIKLGDWRDILVAAGFANSTSVHKDWEASTIAKRTKQQTKAQQSAAPLPSAPLAGPSEGAS